jgi:hypothetical protein
MAAALAASPAIEERLPWTAPFAAYVSSFWRLGSVAGDFAKSPGRDVVPTVLGPRCRKADAHGAARGRDAPMGDLNGGDGHRSATFGQ